MPNQITAQRDGLAHFCFRESFIAWLTSNDGQKMSSGIRVLFLVIVGFPLSACTSDRAGLTNVRLAQTEIESVYRRFQKLTLPMPTEDAWRQIGLPPQEKLELIIGGGGHSTGIHRWVLSDKLPDGSYYTFSVIYRRFSNRSTELLKGYFAIEHDNKDRPSLVLADPTFAFEEFNRAKEDPNQPPQRNAGSRPSSGDSSASETPNSLGPRG